VQLDWTYIRNAGEMDGRNAAGGGWWKKCGWIWLVAEMQMNWAGGKNAAGLGWWHNCS
jgi:hypothetical protein